METTRNRAGHLIKSGAVLLCMKVWHQDGRKGTSWAKVRRALKRQYPAARWNSIDAVVRIAQGAAQVARDMRKNGPDWQPKKVPDARRLIRDRDRE